jgi:hypothetical protein
MMILNRRKITSNKNSHWIKSDFILKRFLVDKGIKEFVGVME